MGKGLDGKTVKSAQRVLEMLDYIGHSDREITVKDVVRDLSYPQSSTSELLSCLVHLGYLRYNRVRRTFQPTLRVAVIGNRVGSPAIRDGALQDMATLICEEHGGPVVLAIMHQRSVMHLHVEGGDRIAAQFRPACPVNDPLGKILLVDCDEAEVRNFVRWRNAEAGTTLSAADLLQELATIRRQGYCVGASGDEFEGLMVTVLLPEIAAERIAVGVTLPDDADSTAIQSAVATLRSAISRKFGGQPVAASAKFMPRPALPAEYRTPAMA